MTCLKVRSVMFFFYGDDTCITFKHGNVLDIAEQLNFSFSSLYDRLIENN